MKNGYNGLMSAINPQESEYDTPDHLKVAKDIAWVIRTLWLAGAVFVTATVWVVALANDVKVNSEKIEEAATKEQMTQVITMLTEMKQDADKADDRQRAIQSQLDRVEQKVEDIDRRTSE